MSSNGSIEQVWQRADGSVNNKNWNLVVDSDGGDSKCYIRVLNDGGTGGNNVLFMTARNSIITGNPSGTNLVNIPDSAPSGNYFSIGGGTVDCPLFVGTNNGITSHNQLVCHFTRPGIADNFLVFSVDNYAPNAAAAAMKIGSISATGRSINATGSINASGSDYAEYISISDTTQTYIPGEIIGLNINGHITNNLSLSKRFLVVSTNPSFVGGDTYNSVINKFEIKPDNYATNMTSVKPIAFCGRVPVNTGQLYILVDGAYQTYSDYGNTGSTGSTGPSYNDLIGHYIIIPLSTTTSNSDNDIVGIITPHGSMTFTDYLNCIGVICSIDYSTRIPVPTIIVKSV